MGTKIFTILTLTTLLVVGSFSSAYALDQDDFFFKTEDNYKSVLVKKVLNTNKILLDSGEVIKFIGIKAVGKPKRKRDELRRNKYGFIIEPEVLSPKTPLEERAFEYTQELLEGEYIRLEFDKKKKDDEHFTIAYIFLKDGTMANAEILRQGFANLQIIPPNFKYAKNLRSAYKEARQEKRGFQGE